jgi:hypothetical protein
MCLATVAIKMIEAIRPSAILFYMKLNIPVIFQEVSGTFSGEHILTTATTSGGLFTVMNSKKSLVVSCHVTFVLCVVKVYRFGREILVGGWRRFIDTAAT